MLITLIDVVSCENPDCREFARIVRGYVARTYYCPVCGNVSHPRAVDAHLACNPEEYEVFLHKAVASDQNGVWALA